MILQKISTDFKKYSEFVFLKKTVFRFSKILRTFYFAFFYLAIYFLSILLLINDFLAIILLINDFTKNIHRF
jgi:hypothetical protein